MNLSARQLYDPQPRRPGRDRAAAPTGLDPDALWLEITESVLMDDAPTAARIFAELRSLGVHLVVDDFGTGYSSLAYLQAFPVEMLKIDRSFVMGLGEDDSSEAIVRAIISLAGSLKLRVVAEGVEHIVATRTPRPTRVRLVPGLSLQPGPARGRARLRGRAPWKRSSVDPTPALRAAHRARPTSRPTCIAVIDESGVA